MKAKTLLDCLTAPRMQHANKQIFWVALESTVYEIRNDGMVATCKLVAWCKRSWTASVEGHSSVGDRGQQFHVEK